MSAATLEIVHEGPSIGNTVCDWCSESLRRGEAIAAVRHPDHHDLLFAHAGPVSYGQSCVDAMAEALPSSDACPIRKDS